MAWVRVATTARAGAARTRVTAVAAAAVLLLAVLPSTTNAAARNHGPRAPGDLRVFDREQPVAVDEVLFSWQPRDVDRNEVQTAAQLRVWRWAPDPDDRVLVWDSGRVPGDEQSWVPYGGPELEAGERYTWAVRTWDRAGAVSPWARGRFDTALGDEDWDAQWIRRDTSDRDDYTLARTEFAVDESPVVRAVAYVTAFHKYELRINGELVDRGPSFHYPDMGYYQATDVTDLLAAGEDAAVGVLYHWYGDGQGRPEAERGMLFRLVVDHADGSRQVITSDGSWKVAPGPWLPAPRRNGDGGDFTEHIDGRAIPFGWDEPDFDDSNWADATVIGTHPVEPFTHLQAGHAPLDEHPVEEVSVTTLDSGEVVVDFGRVLTARPIVHFDEGTAGTEVAMVAGYALDDDGTVDTSDATTQDTDMRYWYTQRDGAQTYEPFTYLGFRYFEITNPGEEITADDVWAINQHTDIDGEDQATFSSSNAMVDAVFDMAKRSALYSAQEQFVDTPTREKGGFLGDAVNISQVTMRAWRERRLTRQSLLEFVDSQERCWEDSGRLNAVYPNGDGCRDIPDYTVQFPFWAWDYYEQTGDEALLAQVYETVLGVAGYVRDYTDPDTGLVVDLAGGSGPYLYGIVDWPAQGRFGYDMETEARTTVNAWSQSALAHAARIAEVLGAPEADSLAADAEALADAMNARLRRPDGVYVDGLHIAGDGTTSLSDHAGQHANAFPLAFGITPPDERAAPAAYLVEGFDGLRMGPMTAHHLLDALGDNGLTEALLERITDTEDFGWADLVDRGYTFTWESWDALEHGQSLSHGWGSTVVLEILETLLGVRTTSPGGATVAVRPPRDVLDWARGSVPTARGMVDVAWRELGRAGATVRVDIPVNVEATVSVPTADPAAVRVLAHGPGPRGVEQIGHDDGYATYRVGSGTTTFRVYPASRRGRR